MLFWILGALGLYGASQYVNQPDPSDTQRRQQIVWRPDRQKHIDGAYRSKLNPLLIQKTQNPGYNTINAADPVDKTTATKLRSRFHDVIEDNIPLQGYNGTGQPPGVKRNRRPYNNVYFWPPAN
jgi:hypothetical protein